MKDFMLKLEEELRKEIKIHCAKNDLTMQEFVISAIIDKLERDVKNVVYEQEGIHNSEQ